MKNRIDCEFKSSSSINSLMQPTVQVDNKIVSKNTLNVIDKTRSAVDSTFGNQIDVSTQVESLTNQLKISILAETDEKIAVAERRIEYNTEQRLNLFEQQEDIKIDNKFNEFQQDIDIELNNFEASIGNKFVPQRLNVFGTMDIRGQNIVPDKAYVYVDVNRNTSTKVDLADVITTTIKTNDVNPETSVRKYDYIFTNLIQGD